MPEPRPLRTYHCHDGTWRYMVAAQNQRFAAALLGCSVYYLRNDGGTYSGEEHTLATAHPRTVFRRRIEHSLREQELNPWVVWRDADA